MPHILLYNVWMKTFTHRTCTHCNRVLVNTEDNFRRTKPTLGSPKKCVDCDRRDNAKHRREQWAANPQASKAANDRWRNTVVSPEWYKRRTLRERYGLSYEDFIKMIEIQDGKCASCKDPLKLNGRLTHIDHDHRTGKVRAIMCHNCNNALGMLHESPERALQLIQYMKDYCNVRKK